MTKPESETDPWAKVTAFLDDIDEIAAIGSAPAMPPGQHTSPPAFRMTPSTAKNLKWNTREIRAEVDAARAAEAAQHQQEIAAKDDELVMLRKGLKEACRQNVELRAERDRLKAALERLRDCDWTIGRGDRMDAVRDIARAALTPQGQSTDGETR